MVTSTITTAFQTIMDFQWDKIWQDWSLGGSISNVWTGAIGATAGTTMRLSPYMQFGYVGAALAFMLSLIGAIDNMSKTVASVEASIDNWMETYSGGDYIDVLKDEETASAMEGFLITFTFDLIAWTLTSILHSCVILGAGYGGAYWIFSKMNEYETTYAATKVPVSLGFKAMVFGMLMGTIGYFAGNVTKNTAESIMWSIGFSEHSYMDQAFERMTTVVTPPVGAPSTKTQQIQTTDVMYDMEKLMKMQEKWFNFFAIQRGLQLIGPYIFIYCVDAALLGALFLLIVYVE